ncbi:hypothetical protein ABZ732_08875 [Streptomyces pseudogriseolus]|uniref:hypothetical protein n=1 Tax=Streptomyces pseudogriseolus TaxID=36817 RepID=UPI00347B1956
MIRYLYAFTEGGRDKADLLGGKGANLAEMTRMGLPERPRRHPRPALPPYGRNTGASLRRVRRRPRLRPRALLSKGAL